MTTHRRLERLGSSLPLLLLLLQAARLRAGAPSSRAEYKALFDRLSAEGCAACVAAGFGWRSAEGGGGRCGGFASSECVGVKRGGAAPGNKQQEEQEEEEEEEDDDWLEGIDGDEDEETGGVAWKDTALTTALWEAVSSGDLSALRAVLEEEEEGAARARAGDGRGPLFWAYEYGMPDMVQLLIARGADPEAKDAKGKTPGDLIGSVSGTWKRGKDGGGASGGASGGDEDDDLDYDPFDEDGVADGDMEGYATAGVSASDAPASRAEYKDLFDRLSAEGCQKCVAEGYGWSKERDRCGGFVASTCA